MSNKKKLVFRKKTSPKSVPDNIVGKPFVIKKENPTWKIMVVDDDLSVHEISNLVFRDFRFEGKALNVLHAYSAKESKQMIRENPDTAMILLDVVMEDDDSGLQVVKYIRDELKNCFVRIVLRTGQPGMAPERDVVSNYQIDDYKTKTELTSQKLYTLLYASLRAYNGLRIIDNNKIGVELLLKAVTDIFVERKVQKFATATLIQLTNLLNLGKSALFCQIKDDFIDNPLLGFYIMAATGSYKSFNDTHLSEFLPENVVKNLQLAAKKKENCFFDDFYILYAHCSSGDYLLFVSETEPLNAFDYHLLELYNKNVVIAYENLLLNQEVEETQRDMICLFGEAVESRSKETGNHIRRVADCSYLLATLSGCDEEFSNTIRLAAPMHDIGKVAIPDSILNKPGPLNDSDWQTMKTHAEIGHHILSGCDREVIQVAANIAYEHHEKWNGEGYPRGLKGEDISREGRITAVVDVFDALAAKRCYKNAWPIEKIVDYFKEQAGQQFDPVLSNLLLEHFDEFVIILKRYEDA